MLVVVITVSKEIVKPFHLMDKLWELLHIDPILLEQIHVLEHDPDHPMLLQRAAVHYVESPGL